jgi:hypothetical protein
MAEKESGWSIFGYLVNACVEPFADCCLAYRLREFSKRGTFHFRKIDSEHN